VKPFDGDMDDYAKFVLDRAKRVGMKPSQARDAPAAEPAAAPAPSAPAPAGPRPKGPSASTLRHAAKKAEEKMAGLTAEIAALDVALAKAAVEQPGKLAELSRKRAATQEALDAAEAAWLEAAEAAETA
jgi:ATP-binding cassette subfamily F protein 3